MLSKRITLCNNVLEFKFFQSELEEKEDEFNKLSQKEHELVTHNSKLSIAAL